MGVGQEPGASEANLGELLRRIGEIVQPNRASTPLAAVIAAANAGQFDDLITLETVETWIDRCDAALETAQEPTSPLPYLTTAFWLTVAVHRQVERRLCEILGAASWSLANACGLIGDTERAAWAWGDAAAAYRTAGEHTACAIALIREGYMLSNLDQTVEALNAHDQAIELLRELIAEGKRELRPALVEGLNSRGGALFNSDQMEEALEAFDESLELCRALVTEGQGQLRPVLVEILRNRFSVLSNLDRPEDALSALEEALGLCRQLVAEGHEQQRGVLIQLLSTTGTALIGFDRLLDGVSLHNEAIELLLREGKAVLPHEDALAVLDDTIGLYRELVVEGPEHLQTILALLLQRRGISLRHLDRLPEGLAAFDEAVMLCRQLIKEKEEDDLLTQLALTLVDQGNALDLLGQHKGALAAYNEAVGLFERLMMNRQSVTLEEGLAVALLNRGLALESLNRPDEALADYDAAQVRLRKLIAEGRSARVEALAMLLSNEGATLRQMLKLASALEALDEAIALYRILIVEGRSDLKIELAKALSNRGSALSHSGRLAEALAAHDEAIALRRFLDHQGRAEVRPDLAMALGNRAITLSSMQRLDEALAGYDEAINLYRQLILEGRTELRPLLARFETNRGVALLRRNHHEEALTVFTDVSDVLRQLIEDGRPELRMVLVASQINRGDALTKLDRGEDAVAAFVEAVTLSQEIGQAADVFQVQALNALAKFYWRSEHRELAANISDAAVGLVEELSGNAARFEDRLLLRDTVRSVYETATLVALDQKDAGAAFVFSQLAKSRTLAELMEARRAKNTPSQDEHTADFEVHRRNEQTQRGHEGGGVSDQELLAIGRPLSPEELIGMLQEREALLDFLDLKDVGLVVVFVWLPAEGLASVDVQRRAPIEAALAAWAGELALVAKTGETNDPFGPALGPEDGGLYELILASHTGFLRDSGVTDVVISASGLLHQVPWPALWQIDNRGERRWLCQDFALSLVPTASSLFFLRQQPAPRGTVQLLAAAPFAGSEPYPTLEALLAGTGTAKTVVRDNALIASGSETRAVSELVQDYGGETTNLVGPEATRTAVVENASGRRLVLLATHGVTVSPGDDPLRFGLALSDEVIRALEVFRGVLSLQDALQVALTACNLGEIASRGDGIVGFTQAFLSAGARTVLAPLWAVDDAATCILSVTHHRVLLNPTQPTVAQAWQQAMATVRSRPGWEHPFFWAAFLPMGDAASRLSA